MKKNWIRLLTMLLAVMLILTMSGVVSLADNAEPVTGDGVSDASSDTSSAVVTEEKTGPGPEGDKPKEGPGDEEPAECTCGATEGEAHREDCPLYEAPEEPGDEPPTECACGAVEGESHREGCPLYVEPEEESPECTCGATEGEAHREDCPLYEAPEEESPEAVRAVIDMIDALPDVGTVANYEPTVDLPEDDEDYNDAYNAAFAVYLEEAKSGYAAAQAAYDALTDEEKALVPEDLVKKLSDFDAFLTMLSNTDVLSLTTRAELRYRYSYGGSFVDWSDPVTQFTFSGGFESAEVAVDRAGGETFTLQYQLKSAEPGKTLELSRPLAVTVQTNAGLHVFPVTEEGEDIYQIQIPMSVLKEDCDDYSSVILSLSFKEDGGGQTGELVFSFKVGKYAGVKADYKPYAGIYGSASGDMIFLWEDGTAIKGAEAASTAKVEIAHLADGTVQLEVYTYSKNYTYRYDAQNGTLTDLDNGQNVYQKVASLTTSGDKDTIKLLKDFAVEKSIVIPDGKEIILDMDGHSITVGSDFTGRPIINYGTLTVTGNGTIDSSASEFGGYGAIDNYGTVTVENGTYRGSVYADGASLKNRPGSTATINGGTFDGSTCAFYNEGKATVNNGSFVTTSCTHVTDSQGEKGHWAYALNSRGELYFNNGSVQGVQGALAISNGYAEVKDGRFETVPDTDGNDSCAHYAIYIAGEVGEVEAHVSGGTFKSASKVAILVGNDNTGGDGGINAKATAYISGGTFTGGNGKALDAGTNTGNPSITGGTFNSDVSAYVAAGYKCEQKDDKYVIVDDNAYVVEVDGAGRYKTVGEAVAAAENSATIRLLADTSEDVVIPSGKTLTLDLNGKTLTNASTHTIINHGTLTLTGGGKVDNVTHARAPVYNDVGGTMTVGNVTVDRSKEAGSSATESGGNSWYYILNHGTMTIDGATVRSNGCYSSLIENGWQSPGQNTGKVNSVMTIKSGTFSVDTFASGGLYVLKNDDYGVMTVEGGTFTAGDTEGGVVLNWNELTIKGGTFNGNGKPAIVNAVEADGNGTPKYSYEKGSVLIKGGSFNGKIGNHSGYPNGKISASGGSYDRELDARYVAEGYACVRDGSRYVVSITDDETKAQVAAAIAEAEKVLTGSLSGETLAGLAGSELTPEQIAALKSGKEHFTKALEILNAIDPDRLQAVLNQNPDLKTKVEAIRALAEVAFAITEEKVQAKTEVEKVEPPKADTAGLAPDAVEKLDNEIKQKTDALKNTVEAEVTGNSAAQKEPEGLKEAVRLESLEIPEDTKEVKLTVVPTLTAIEAGADVDKTDASNPSADVYPTTLVFEVVPQATIVSAGNVESVVTLKNDQIKGAITFRLPIPSTVTARYAKIVHVFSDGSGSETLYPEIETEDGGKFVEVTVSKFSTFTLTFTNSKPSGGHSSGGSGGSGGGSASFDNYEFWAKVQKSIERADDGDIVKANATKALNVPGSVLRALEGRDVTLVISYKGRELAIYGGNMPPIPDNKVYYTFDDLFDLFADYDVTVSEIPEAKPGSNPVTGGGYYLPGVTVPTVTLTAELPATPEVPDRITLEPAEKAVEPAVPADAAQAAAPAPVPANRHLSGVAIALAALIAAVAVGGITTGVWLYKRREQE
ncbi:hypothetical protein [uncultured Anaerotruncus sp.]|uniref:hypothetical protein n=1 Tax=uncultured Anaerotruncus sp. TaxID=905011 RepID=UPI00280A5F6C|nr:hypothetical protein [uncultured Anaerotruncus sp.]